MSEVPLVFGIQGAGCRVQGSGFRVQASGCRVQGLSADATRGHTPLEAKNVRIINPVVYKSPT